VGHLDGFEQLAPTPPQRGADLAWASECLTPRNLLRPRPTVYSALKWGSRAQISKWPPALSEAGASMKKKCAIRDSNPEPADTGSPQVRARLFLVPDLPEHVNAEPNAPVIPIGAPAVNPDAEPTAA